MRGETWCITQWCKAITDSGKDEVVMEKPDNMSYKFRLKDGDGVIYAYGYCTTNDDEAAFEPLDDLENAYGVVSIEYYNNGKWEML